MLETMKRILTMAGKYRHKVTIGIIISLLHSFFSAMDLFAILYISWYFGWTLDVEKAL